MKRRAKIVATIGPATESVEQIERLIDAGMNVARMNLSHGSYEVHERVYRNLREASANRSREIAVLVDLQGPKIRLGKFAQGPHELAPGDVFTITTDDILGDQRRCGTTFKGLPHDVKPGDLILIDDGRITLRATEVTATDVVTSVVVGGTVSNNKGINLPGVAVNVPALSEKDEADLRWALRLGADVIALSFVRDASDIERVHEIMREEERWLPVVAKLEKPQAVEHLQEIIDAFDAIMVARGDLGVELPLESVPVVQKRAIELARRWAKPVIVATQMLETMITESRPTRAEASDCANAVLDGADALMLSGETSVGAYPVEAVQTMARIIQATEQHALGRIPPLGTKPHTQSGAITKAAVEVAEFLDAKYLCAFTTSGDTARRMSRLRSAIPMLAFTFESSTLRRMSLYWGVEPHTIRFMNSSDAMVDAVEDALVQAGLVEPGDKVVMVSGSPPGVSGHTNDVRVLTIGDGKPASEETEESLSLKLRLGGFNN